MNKIIIPTLLIATVIAAGFFAFSPVEQASTIHTTITDVAMINTNSPDKEDKDDNIGKKDVNFGKDAEHTVTITIEVTK